MHQASAGCCPCSHLPRTVDLLSACDIVLSVHERMEGYSEARSDSVRKSVLLKGAVAASPHKGSYASGSSGTSGVVGAAAQLSQAFFLRDGILLSPRDVVIVLMKVIMKEM